MKNSKNTKKKAETKSDYFCEFCEKEFVRESMFLKHSCKYQLRWKDKDLKSNVIGFQTWIHFYNKTSPNVKQRTYLDFIKSPYYTAFVKFGHYCMNVNVINVSRYVDYLLKEKISVDSWNSDKQYTKFLTVYLKDEDPLDAVARSIETTIELAKTDSIQTKDCFRYGNKNRICYAITTGKISPWILYQSESGKQFLENLDETQIKMIVDYVNPEQWAIKFLKNKDMVPQIKQLLIAGGY